MEPAGPLIFTASFGRDMGYFFSVGHRRSSVGFCLGTAVSPLLKIK